MEKTKKNDLSLFLIITGLTLILRLLTLMEVNVGVDNMDYWYSAKALIHGYDYGGFSHRNIRWGIIVPTALIQLIFSSHAWVIYVPPILMSLLMNLSIKVVAERLFNRPTAYLAIVLVQFFPYTIRLGSQLFLALFSINYLLFSLYYLLRYLDPQSRREIKHKNFFLVISLLMFFLAYETKISNIYFLPVFLILIYKKRGIKTFFLYGGVLLTLYLLEHVLYFIFADEPLGRLGIIVSTHFEHNSNMAMGTSNFTGTFMGIFRRFIPPYFDSYWHAVFWGGILSGIFLLISSKRVADEKESKSVLLLLSLILIYTFVLTFGVKSIHPVIPFEPFIVRYFAPVLPFLMILISRVLLMIPELKLFPAKLRPEAGMLTFLFFFLFTGIFIISCFLSFLPTGAMRYLNNPLKPGDHVITKMLNKERRVNSANKTGMLLASWSNCPTNLDSDRCGLNALNMVNKLYLNLNVSNSMDKGKYSISSHVLDDGREFHYIDISRDGGSSINWKKLHLLIAFQKPFELIEEELQ